MASADCSEQSDVRKSSEEECVPGTDIESKSSEEQYVPPEIKEEATISNLNQLLTPLGQSPISKRARKVSVVNETVKYLMSQLSGIVTSHGKSPWDGVCGTVKRLAAHASPRGTQITNPKELYDRAKTNIPGVDISFTGKEQHENEADILNNDRFLRLKTVPGTRSILCVVPVFENKISVKNIFFVV
ncbi:hypothetical protein ANN_20174 [Periplaneta americana]|uniref:Uncharacterized protein n=1 Tax=Periplaneta americana TaxID=6978 RepID=A0ABQ8SC40_PERAM|nr:hypothetical protein ANN_20174 [Periplaneta americana]